MEVRRHTRRHPPSARPPSAAHLRRPSAGAPRSGGGGAARRQEAVSAAPADLTLVAARDTARKAHAEALTALRQRYEQKESRADRYAQASERVAAIGGAADTTPAGLSAEAAAAAMPRALESSLPVLRLCTEEIAAANRKTVAALDTLLNAMSEELALIRSVKGPSRRVHRVRWRHPRRVHRDRRRHSARRPLAARRITRRRARARGGGGACGQRARGGGGGVRDLEGLQEEELQLADAADELNSDWRRRSATTNPKRSSDCWERRRNSTTPRRRCANVRRMRSGRFASPPALPLH